MRYLYILFMAGFFVACSDAPPPQFVENSKEIQAIIDERLLNSVEFIVALFALMLLTIGYGFFNFNRKKDEIIKEIENRMSFKIDKMFTEKEAEIYKNISKKTTTIIKKISKKQRQESQKEEFLRNMLLNDLNKMRATEQQSSDNVSKAFNDHADRYHVVSQLTSGIKEQQTKALKKLSTGVYKKIIKLRSLKDYLEFLKESDIDLDTLDHIAKLELNL